MEASKILMLFLLVHLSTDQSAEIYWYLIKSYYVVTNPDPDP